MNKGLFALSVAVLFAVSGCNFFCGKKEEEKTQETKQVAENDMANVDQAQAANDAEKGSLMAMAAGEGQVSEQNGDASSSEQPMDGHDMPADMDAADGSHDPMMDEHAGHDHSMGAGEPVASQQ